MKITSKDAKLGLAALRAADQKKLEKISADIHALIARAHKLLPKEAYVVGGKYDGRLARIDGICVDGDNLRISTMVYKATRGGGPINRTVLNSDGESRRVRRLNELTFIYQEEMSI